MHFFSSLYQKASAVSFLSLFNVYVVNSMYEVMAGKAALQHKENFVL
jgi:hypothetical protein